MTAVFALLSRVWLVLKVGKILWNLPKLYRFSKRFGFIASEVVKEQRLPNRPESQEFLRSIAELMRAQIIDFPNLDEDELAEKFEQLANEMEQAA